MQEVTQHRQPHFPSRAGTRYAQFDGIRFLVLQSLCHSFVPMFFGTKIDVTFNLLLTLPQQMSFYLPKNNERRIIYTYYQFLFEVGEVKQIKWVQRRPASGRK